MLLLTTVEPKRAEAALVRAAQNGDRRAFAALYQEYGRLVHGIVLAHVSYQDAEDLTQEVFVKVLGQLHTLREPAAFGGWLTAIARRTATDFLRKSKKTFWIDLIAEKADREDHSFALLHLIQKLPEAYRETLILRLVEGMTGPEIAARTGLTPDSVRVNLCRGMKLLRSQWEGPAKT